jgi:hypothetical protein
MEKRRGWRSGEDGGEREERIEERARRGWRSTGEDGEAPERLEESRTKRRPRCAESLKEKREWRRRERGEDGGGEKE